MMGKGLMITFLVFLLFQPNFADAQSEKEDLERLIKRVDKRRDTPDKVEVFKGLVAGYYYTSHSILNEILKDLTPGETLTVVSISTLSKRDPKEIAQMKKEGMEWSQIAEKVGITLKDVIKDIRTYIKIAGC